MPAWKEVMTMKSEILFLDEKTLTEEDWEDLAEEVNCDDETEEQD